MSAQPNVFGGGFKFPFHFDPDTGGVATNSGPDSVDDCLTVILGTILGECLMNPFRGSRIHKFLFELDTDTSRQLLQNYILEALGQEPRIGQLLGITMDTTQIDLNTLVVTVSYRPIQQNIDRNLVFPLVRG